MISLKWKETEGTNSHCAIKMIAEYGEKVPVASNRGKEMKLIMFPSLIHLAMAVGGVGWPRSKGCLTTKLTIDPRQSILLKPLHHIILFWFFILFHIAVLLQSARDGAGVKGASRRHADPRTLKSRGCSSYTLFGRRLLFIMSPARALSPMPCHCFLSLSPGFSIAPSYCISIDCNVESPNIPFQNRPWWTLQIQTNEPQMCMQKRGWYKSLMYRWGVQK